VFAAFGVENESGQVYLIKYAFIRVLGKRGSKNAEPAMNSGKYILLTVANFSLVPGKRVGLT
jgi:hypothetical protein